MSAESVDRGAVTGPRSRSERSADSRLLILDAAVACLVEDGYAGASTLAVQAPAGVPRGRLLHHFPSRAELLVAAAEHLATTQLDEVGRRAAALMDDEPTGRERVDRGIELMWATFQEPPFWAAMELWMAARTDPALRAALRGEERRLPAPLAAVAARPWGSPTPSGVPRSPVPRCTPTSANSCSRACEAWRWSTRSRTVPPRPIRTWRSGSGWPPGCSRSTGTVDPVAEPPPRS